MILELSGRERFHLINIVKQELERLADWHFRPSWDVPPIDQETLMKVEQLYAKLHEKEPRSHHELRSLYG